MAIEDLGLEHLWIVDSGDTQYFLDEKITAIPLQAISELAASLKRAVADAAFRPQSLWDAEIFVTIIFFLTQMGISDYE